MHIKLDQQYGDILRRLADKMREPTGASAARAAIREAAIKHGVWEEPGGEEVHTSPHYSEGITE